jgi:hypothetical protein
MICFKFQVSGLLRQSPFGLVSGFKLKCFDDTLCTRDGSGKPGTKKYQFSQAKKATNGSSFWVVENGIFCEDLQRTARNGAIKRPFTQKNKR